MDATLSLFKGTGVTGIGLGGSGLTELRPPAAHLSSLGRRTAATGVSVDRTSDQPGGSLNYLARPFRFLWAPTPAGEPGVIKAFVEEEVGVEAPDTGSSDGNEEEEEEEIFGVNDEQENWVMKILHIRSIWSEKKSKDSVGKEGHYDEEVPNEEEEEGYRDMESPYSGGCSECCGADEDEEGSCEIGEGGEGRVEFDASTFSKFLNKVPLSEARMFAQMSYLGNLAYAIRKIKPANLLKYHGMRFVTSSLEMREMKRRSCDENVKSTSEKVEKILPANDKEMIQTDAKAEVEKQKRFGHQISASAAYQIAAAAASYVQSQTRNILPFTSPKGQTQNVNEGESEDNAISSNMTSSKMASFVATTNSVTAVVAAEESLKQAVAKDLNSVNSSPCEWFICDEENTETRLFVIQGSETLASWQANLLFEPIKFEGLDVLVHRGIYEAAKGMYKQMLPAVEAHLKRYGKAAKLRFTGHSLGGSLALLVNLMLLIREDVPRSSLLPVVAFGSPSIMCGGDGLLRKLGLPRSHVQAIIMHRDIVPRAFSCHYPDHVAELLKAVNGNFRNHPCLRDQNILYAPMGELLILQPDKNFSPEHPFLPTGTGFYRVCAGLGSNQVGLSTRELRTAVMAFLNSPHPLEILSDRAAYGSEGTVYRDHDMNSYLRSLRFLIRQELNRLRAKKVESSKIWWPLIVSKTDSDHAVVFTPASAVTAARKHRLIFAGILQSGKQSLRQISRFVTSQHLHLLMLMVPARLVLLSAVTNSTLH